ncbi:MAG: hypothetical protein Roseis2KO_09210 [Roseivirga sp.]
MKIPGYVLNILFLGVLVSCRVASDSIQKGDQTVMLKGNDYVVFEYREDIFIPFKKSTKTTLSESELAEIEIILKKMVRENNSGAGSMSAISLKGKRRQYVPVINKNGEKEVWINFFCSVRDDKWKGEIIAVFDGGNCFFNLKINLTEMTYYDLRVNGYA